MNVTRIAIQGRARSTEFVTEFAISYGHNGLDYADYKEPGGYTKVFIISQDQSFMCVCFQYKLHACSSSAFYINHNFITIFNTKSGSSAWSPQDSTYNNFLWVDLGARKEIRALATAGRPGSREFVSEYAVQYSDDGDAWKSCTDTLGDVQVILWCWFHDPSTNFPY